MSDHQVSNFNERIKRIGSPRNNSYRDPETGMMIPKRMSIGQIKEHNFGGKPSLVQLVLSLVLGTAALMVARYVRFTYAEIPEAGTEAQTLMLMDFGLAAVIAFVAGGLIKHKSSRHMVAQAAGIAGMMVAMHNLVWLYPSEFAQVYSPEYVEQVRSLTEPQSLYVRGETITL